jgi:hypothetical protein
MHNQQNLNSWLNCTIIALSVNDEFRSFEIVQDLARWNIRRRNSINILPSVESFPFLNALIREWWNSHDYSLNFAHNLVELDRNAFYINKAFELILRKCLKEVKGLNPKELDWIEERIQLLCDPDTTNYHASPYISYTDLIPRLFPYNSFLAQQNYSSPQNLIARGLSKDFGFSKDKPAFIQLAGWNFKKTAENLELLKKEVPCPNVEDLVRSKYF